MYSTLEETETAPAGAVAAARWVANDLVVCAFYRSIGQTMLFNLAENSSFAVASPLILELLAHATEPRTREELVEFVRSRAEIDAESAGKLVRFCADKELLRDEEAAGADQAVAALERWRRFGWDGAAIYHFFTRDFPFLDYSRPEAYTTDQGLMSEYKGRWLEPPRYKEYTGRPFIPLEVAEKAMSDVSLHALQDMRLAKPDAAPVDRARLGTLLYYTFGQTGAIRYPIVEPLLRRTSPSGGARHPTEGYLAVFDPIDDIPPGLYHYSVKEQGLEEVAPGQFRDQVFAALDTLSERDELEPRAIVFYTSLVERNMWRYREPRTYRVVHLDLGHLTWTSYLAATGLGIRTFAHHGMDDAAIERLFGLDPVHESVYWYMALG
ncbi:MAG TPA: SagB/ThcOx family dehydrogenase [Longimicrobiaceae bacterium]|nr:SagB/ThcOx family dehydrogenase [Longimicrobiaceae bacterium]